MAEIKTQQFSEGVSVSAPSTLAKITNKLANYANDAAFVADVGVAADGHIYWNTTELAIRAYNGTVWEYYYGTSKLQVSCLDNQTDTDITGLLYDKANIQSVEMTIAAFRRDDGQDATEIFRLVLAKDSEADAWLAPFVSSDGVGSGVTFSVSAAGQLRYSSSNYAGANYTGELRISHIKQMKVTL